MSTLNIPPTARVPIGFAETAGGRVDVTLNPEWARYFEKLTNRAGGVSGPGTRDVQSSTSNSIDAMRETIEALQAGEMVMQQPAANATYGDVMQASATGDWTASSDITQR